MGKNLNFKNWGNSINKLFGGGKKNAGPPPNTSGYTSLNRTYDLTTGSYVMNPQININTGTIQMPTQHHFLGVNMTALSEGNFFQQAIYGSANSLNIVGQYLMGRGVGDFTMRNLDGSATSTDEAAISYGTLPLLFVGGEGFTSITGGLKQWIRTGPSYSIEGGVQTISTRWGAGGNYWKKIGSPTLQKVNKNFRKIKLPGNNWRVNDPGHFHWWKK